MLYRDERYFLIVQRVENDSYLPGLWEFPGGKVDVMPPNFYAEARREASEEVLGLPLIENFFLDSMLKDLGEKEKYHNRKVRYMIFFGHLVPPTLEILGKMKPGDEHQAVELLPIDDVLKKNLTPITRRIISELIKTL